MNVQCYMTNVGVIMGEVVESSGPAIRVKNPVTIVSHGEQTGLANILNFFVENEMTIQSKDIISGPFTPITDILNYYNKQFGTGLIVPKNDGLILT